MSVTKYHKHVRVIHALSALLIISLFVVGKVMEKSDNEVVMSLMPFHAIGGYVLLFLTIYRTWLLFKKERPAPVETGKAWNQKLMYVIHRAFYVLMFVAIASGMTVVATGGYPEAFEAGDAALITGTPLKPVHGITTLLLIVLLIAHIGGVVRHYLRTKENTLKRIV
ncbi:MAG: Uncharacterised protein [Cryomorphaceae bacterium]|nr:MAG: Uncharacterised protein [Cryomorphaceae bacterium]